MFFEVRRAAPRIVLDIGVFRLHQSVETFGALSMTHDFGKDGLCPQGNKKMSKRLKKQQNVGDGTAEAVGAHSFALNAHFCLCSTCLARRDFSAQPREDFSQTAPRRILEEAPL